VGQNAARNTTHATENTTTRFIYIRRPATLCRYPWLLDSQRVSLMQPGYSAVWHLGDCIRLQAATRSVCDASLAQPVCWLNATFCTAAGKYPSWRRNLAVSALAMRPPAAATLLPKRIRFLNNHPSPPISPRLHARAATLFHPSMHLHRPHVPARRENGMYIHRNKSLGLHKSSKTAVIHLVPGL
jgi:hypothetical protein